MDAVDFKAYIAERLLSESGEEIGEDFGVTRQAVYRWRDGETPSKMALIIAQNLGKSNIGLITESKEVPQSIPVRSSVHNTKTCRIYRCGMCSALKSPNG